MLIFSTNPGALASPYLPTAYTLNGPFLRTPRPERAPSLFLRGKSKPVAFSVTAPTHDAAINTYSAVARSISLGGWRVLEDSIRGVRTELESVLQGDSSLDSPNTDPTPKFRYCTWGCPGTSRT